MTSEIRVVCDGEHASPTCGDPCCYHGPGTPETRAFPEDTSNIPADDRERPIEPTFPGLSSAFPPSITPRRPSASLTTESESRPSPPPGVPDPQVQATEPAPDPFDAPMPPSSPDRYVDFEPWPPKPGDPPSSPRRYDTPEDRKRIALEDAIARDLGRLVARTWRSAIEPMLRPTNGELILMARDVIARVMASIKPTEPEGRRGAIGWHDAGEEIQRIEVPGGWLYRKTDHSLMAFVPTPPTPRKSALESRLRSILAAAGLALPDDE